jgi:uncharacterized membrane protein YeaQ/YmgE (transglycosylase-associated protein family)
VTQSKRTEFSVHTGSGGVGHRDSYRDRNASHIRIGAEPRESWTRKLGVYRSNFRFELSPDEQQIGWIAAVVIGAIDGWLAEQFMKSQMGLLMNIVLGIVGAAVASWLFSLIGISLGGWIGYLIAGFIGACILIAIGRAFKRA